MKDLLDFAMRSHGGLNRWKTVNAVKAAASITGAIWHVKGKPDYLKDVVFEVQTKRERVTMDFPGQNKRSVFEPMRVEMQENDGTVVETRDDPESAFAKQDTYTPWDDMHVAYFSGEALFTYFNAPFLYSYEGFSSEEIAPIDVEGERWRRLKVTFPRNVKSHTREQISCFGPDGLLRRHDYTVDILGGATGLNYALEYRNIDGIFFPMKRRVYAYEGDYQIIREPLLVNIDISSIALLKLGDHH